MCMLLKTQRVGPFIRKGNFFGDVRGKNKLLKNENKKTKNKDKDTKRMIFKHFPIPEIVFWEKKTHEIPMCVD